VAAVSKGPTEAGAATCAGYPLAAVAVELGRLLERRMYDALRPQGITASQFMALARIVTHPGISRANLARGLQITPQATGGITAQLVAKGLVHQPPPVEPGLPTAFTATDEGRRVFAATEPDMASLGREMLGFFRPNLANAMDGGLRHLRKRLPRPPAELLRPARDHPRPEGGP
jgi:DNA-binding MarR family transcriptional regulator